ncbi:hypothetical protein AMECASPLE_009493 [Ameca splendens]|uniref:Uncharacterized protein n=1 Tax=Ameca splendens TaxID=208324 RepID=A0ABV0YY49_9TELE
MERQKALAEIRSPVLERPAAASAVISENRSAAASTEGQPSTAVSTGGEPDASAPALASSSTEDSVKAPASVSTEGQSDATAPVFPGEVFSVPVPLSVGLPSSADQPTPGLQSSTASTTSACRRRRRKHASSAPVTAGDAQALVPVTEGLGDASAPASEGLPDASVLASKGLPDASAPASEGFQDASGPAHSTKGQPGDNSAPEGQPDASPPVSAVGQHDASAPGSSEGRPNAPAPGSTEGQHKASAPGSTEGQLKVPVFAASDQPPPLMPAFDKPPPLLPVPDQPPPSSSSPSPSVSTEGSAGTSTPVSAESQPDTSAPAPAFAEGQPDASAVGQRYASAPATAPEGWPVVPVLGVFEDEQPPLPVPVSEGFEDEEPPVVPVPEGFEDKPPLLSVPVLEGFEDELPPSLEPSELCRRSPGLQQFLPHSSGLQRFLHRLRGSSMVPRLCLFMFSYRKWKRIFGGSKLVLVPLGYGWGQNCSSLLPASAPASADLADVSSFRQTGKGEREGMTCGNCRWGLDSNPGLQHQGSKPRYKGCCLNPYTNNSGALTALTSTVDSCLLLPPTGFCTEQLSLSTQEKSQDAKNLLIYLFRVISIYHQCNY